MKLLIYQWNSYMQYDLYAVCRELHISYDVFEWQLENKSRDEEFSAWFRSNVDPGRYDALLSVDYFPILSEECRAGGLKYLAWCLDAPLNMEQMEDTLGNEMNSVFFFDRALFEEYYVKGFRTVYHLPPGVNRTRLANLRVTDEDRMRYAADVSFAGRLDKSVMQDLMAPLDDYSKGYVKCMMDMQSQIYGEFILDNGITDEFVDSVNLQYREADSETKPALNKAALLAAMTREITRRDRLILLSLCGRRFDTRFYTDDNSVTIDGVKKSNPLDYVTEMPRMFACSRMNLSPSPRSIRTGIPMRALHIMGAGGFLLSNWQEELAESFEDGKEMAVYESYEDAVDKIEFYLKQEALREEIARRGKAGTLERFSLQRRLQDMFSYAGI